MKGFLIPKRLPEKNIFVKVIASIVVIIQHLLFGLFTVLLGKQVTLKIMRGQVWEAYIESDLIIVGHDNVLITPYGYVLLFSYVCSIILGKIIRTPVVIYAGSVGFSSASSTKPMRYRFLSHLLSPFLNWTDLITVRDQISYNNLAEMGIQRNRIKLTADVAFLLQPGSLQRGIEILEAEQIRKGSLPLIGVTLTHQITAKAKPETNLSCYETGIKMTARALDISAEKLNATILFIPHCIEPGPGDDRLVAKDVMEKMVYQSCASLILNEYSVEDLKALIGQCDLFLGERTHSVINAVTMGIPSVNLSFSNDQRATSLLYEILENGKQVIYIDRITSEEIALCLERTWEKKDQIQKDTLIKVEQIKVNAMKNGEMVKILLDSYNKLISISGHQL